MTPRYFSLFLTLLLATVAALPNARGELPSQGLGIAGDPVTVDFDSTATTEELLDSAREMFIADNYVLSEMLYKSVLVRDPSNVSAMLELAVLYEALGKLEHARGLLTRASLTAPSDREITRRLNAVVDNLSRTLRFEVDSLMTIGQHELAIPKLGILLTTQPENADLLYQKAICHLSVGRTDVALGELDKALRLQKKDAYFQLRAEIVDRTRTRQVRAIRARAESLIAGGITDSNRQKALNELSHLLEIEPENEWAKEQFMALTEPQEPSPGSRAIAAMRSFKATLVEWSGPVAGFAVSIASILNENLGILLILFIALVILGSPLTHFILRGFSPRQSLTGRLEQFSIHELLSLLNTHQSTGALKLNTPSAHGHVYFSKGEVYHCTAAGMDGREAVQELLLDAHEGSFVFLSGKRASQKTVDTPLSLILMELPEREGAITSKSILKKQQSKMKQLLNR